MTWQRLVVILAGVVATACTTVDSLLLDEVHNDQWAVAAAIVCFLGLVFVCAPVRAPISTGVIVDPSPARAS